MLARICPLFSGSSGNSYYIGSKSEGILVDAGCSAKKITDKLSQCEIDINAIKAILVTHEHSDHINAVRILSKRYRIPLYASNGTLDFLESRMELAGAFAIEGIFEIAGLEVIPFHTSHDSAESIGFRIHTPDDRAITIATDLGYISQEVRKALHGADFVVIESNHDIAMLRDGPYPSYLKRRILSDCGHLSNEVCAQILPELINTGTTRVLLAHISDENNTPSLAVGESARVLEDAGYKRGDDFLMAAAPKENTSGKSIIF